MTNVAVVGAGIFGITVALKLEQQGYDVHLYEKNNNILNSASLCNQYRIHKGYHYPRSPETVKALLESVPLFEQEYKDVIIKRNEHYYCIANRDSFVSGLEYRKFCTENKLPYHVVDNDLVKNVQLCIRADENLIDPYILRDMCTMRLNHSKIKLYLGIEFTKNDIEDFDYVVNCTYANINGFLEEDKQKDYQYELCEKIVVSLPKQYDNKSIVIMDGPFMCLDPFGRTGNFILGNVVHAIHETSIGKKPIWSKTDKKILGALDQGIVRLDEKTSKFKDFISSGKEFIPGLEMAKYRGSMITIRTVLPNLEKTDARPTLVNKVKDNIINVFSGKIDTCVKAANLVLEKIKE